MHALEKILCRASGKDKVVTGEIVTVKVDLAEINDIYLQTLISFEEMGGVEVFDKDRIAFVFDHYAPAPTVSAARNHKLMREFAAKHGISHVFDVDKGVCHQVLPEAGLVYPGMVLIATDSHTTTHGAFGAFGTGVGATDLAYTMISGETWMRVPEIIEIRIDGKPRDGVLPKDVILHVVGKMKANGAVYKAIDFTGSYVHSLDVAGRMVLCNMAVEMGAKTAYIQPDECVINYVRSRGAEDFTVFETDPGYEYSEVHTFDVTGMGPQVAVPASVDNVRPLSSLKERIHVDQCFVGSCTGGRATDIREVAAVLKEKHIANGTRMIVIPASVNVMKECLADGSIQTLIEAGAVLSPPGCGPCLGVHEGLLASGETCVTTSNRNFPSRMGAHDAKLYLASPRVVAEAAVSGYIGGEND